MGRTRPWRNPCNDYLFNNNMLGVSNMQGAGVLTLGASNQLSDLNVLTGELRIGTDQPTFPGKLPREVPERWCFQYSRDPM